MMIWTEIRYVTFLSKLNGLAIRIQIENIFNFKLVALCKSLKKDMDTQTKEFTKYESELREELVSSWSKRVEETEGYYQ